MAQFGSNTQLGIQLAQQGRKVEALPYLRHAVMTEPATAEVWLWLAHVSPDLAEYRNCVHQALVLDATHPTALRMQQDLDFQAWGAPPPIAAPLASQAMDRGQASSRRLRRILLLVIAIVLVIGCGRGALWLSQNVDENDLNRVIPFQASTKRIQFAVGLEQSAYAFSAEIPRTWVLADSGSPSWRAERDRLQAEFPNEAGQVNLWRSLEADLGEIQRDPSTGDLSQAVSIVEADSAIIQTVYPSLPTIQLTALQALPPQALDNGCEAMRLLAGEAEQRLSQQAGYLSTQVKQRDNRDCIYYSEFSDDTGPVPLRVLELVMPILDDQLGRWEIRLPEAQYEEYQTALDRFMATVRSLETIVTPMPTPNAGTESP
jgi:hypothetical protein